VMVLQGRGVVGGKAEGVALVTNQAIAGWGGIDPLTGTIIETGHQLKGISFRGKVLVFPGAKGSSSWSAFFHTTRLANAAPSAMVFKRMTTRIALGAIVMRAPAVMLTDLDPFECVATGDIVTVDGDMGTVAIRKPA
jgi:predicted aconitase with swiveling domain